MILRWLFSKTVRNAVAMRKYVQRLLNAQYDLLSSQAIAAVQIKIDELNDAISKKANNGKIRIKAEELQFAAEKWIKPYPNAVWRENVEVLLVALAVAMGIRTFFLQPFKIPTGSMQPTLYGVTSLPDFSPIYYQIREGVVDKSKIQQEMNAELNSVKIPGAWQRIKDWFHGISYIHVVAKNDGELQAVNPPVRFLIFNIYQTIVIGGVTHIIWFPPDYGEQSLISRAALFPRNNVFQGRYYHKGDDVVKIEVKSGDHLFVDRLTYNFRKPERGEIIVFETAGIPKTMRESVYPPIPGNEFYIKRLVVLPGERVQIGDDRHLIINGQRLDASTPHFENIYGFNPSEPPRESQWSGHVNGTVAREYNLYPNLAPLFPNQATVYTNAADSYMAMGDNTCNSSDSRTWGSLATKSVIGKAFFVYWPITDRFGFGNQ